MVNTNVRERIAFYKGNTMLVPHPALLGASAPGYTDSDPPPSGTPEHEEWLLDLSVEHTFPASDPPSTSYPGGTLSIRRGRANIAAICQK
jgi:hypothetical protein